MRNTVTAVLFTVSAVLFAGSACFAQLKRSYVQIQNAPDTELCISTSKAVQDVRKEAGRLKRKFRDRQTSSKSAVQAMGLSFYTLLIKHFVTIDSSAERMSFDLDYYLLDIDNNGSVEMITIVSGGHMAAGEGDTLSILKDDVSSAAQPVPHDALGNVALEIGPLSVRFEGKDFDNGYYIYPFAFQGKNYLLIEGNRDQYRKDLVAELVLGTGIVTRCYF